MSTSRAQVLSDRTAIVTGGARGLGYAIASALSGNGADIVLIDLLENVEHAAATLEETEGVKARGFRADVTDERAIGEVLDSVEREFGPATILVNAAGIATSSPALEVSSREWRKLLDVNVTGTFIPSREFARRAVASGKQATIVNISSMSSRIVNIPQTQAAYNVSKAAVEMLTKSLAIEWLPLGVRVNSIAPGYFSSDMTRDFVKQNPEMTASWISKIPIGRMGQPEELGELVVYLASDRSSYVVGQNIVIDGGYTIV